MRSWRLSPACPTAPWSFRSLRKTVCRLLWIWCFPCSLLLGGRPVFRLLPVEGSMPQLGEFYTLIRGGIIPPHPLARVLHPRATFRRQTFISAAPAMKRRLNTPREKSKIFPAGIPAFLVLTALRHSGRTFTVHAAESAEIPKWLCPLTPRGTLYPSIQNVYNKVRRALRRCPQCSAQYYIKRGVRG